VPAIPTDAELLDALRRTRSDELFRLVVDRHGKTVMASCRQILSDPADLADAFQATFVVLFRKLGLVNGATLSAWLYAVAHRVALRTLSDRQRRIVKENRAAKLQSSFTVAKDSSARSLVPTEWPARQTPDREIPHNEISWRESVQILHEEIDQLPEGCRQVLILCYLRGHSREEAALCLNWSVGAVKGMLERGRKKLAARLAKRGITWSVGLLAVVTGSSAQAMVPTPTLIDMTVQAATHQPAHGWGTSWFLGGFGMARKAMQGFLCLAAAAVLLLGLTPGEGSGNGRAAIDEVAARHQKTMASFKTLHLKLEFLGEEHGPYQQELWKDGENHRWTTTNFLRPGGKQEALVKEGKVSNWVQAKIEGVLVPLYSGSINPSSKETRIDPLGHCLFGCLDQATTETRSIPFDQVLNEPGATCECEDVSESGRDYAVVKCANKNYSREIWFSKNHNYLVSKLIQKSNGFPDKYRNLRQLTPVQTSPGNESSEINPTVIFSVEEFTEVSPGLHFPAKVTTRMDRGPVKDPLVSTVMVRSIEVNRPVAPSSFDFQFPPDLLVWDGVEKKVWRTDEHGALGVEARNENGTLISFTYRPTSLIDFWAPLLVGSLVIAGLLAFVVKRLRLQQPRALPLI